MRLTCDGRRIARRRLTYDDVYALHCRAGESHFDLRIVSPAFRGVRSLKRHQMIYAALQPQMELIHALSIKALTPEEADA